MFRQKSLIQLVRRGRYCPSSQKTVNNGRHITETIQQDSHRSQDSPICLVGPLPALKRFQRAVSDVVFGALRKEQGENKAVSKVWFTSL